jgi:polyphosphate kinase 2 (PPK2 family)
MCEAIGAAVAKPKGRREAKPPMATAAPALPVLDEMPTILDKVDLTKALGAKEYEETLRAAQLRLRKLQIEATNRKVACAIVYEGWDAAGKGGNIRRLVRTLDPRSYRVVPIGKPTPGELSRHYLWRFWLHVPRAGRITIYDRSWYGRVLVERIEGFCTEDEWRRAYQEINEFELLLYREGMAIVKFWLHITPEEQLARFEARKADPHRAWKITDEDWRNREKWDQYRESVDEMITRTSTTYAPWTIVEGNDKKWARVRTINATCDALEQAIDRAPKPRRRSARRPA